VQKSEPKYRRPLNPEQVEILDIIYKFRFVTVAALKDYFFETNPGMNVFRRLETLAEQGFIAKRYFDNYRLLHKPVVYYLLPDGARKLDDCRDEDEDEVEVKRIYRDGVVAEQFAMHCVAIFDLYNRLDGQYGDDLDFLTKSDQANLDDFPKLRPDAYLVLETDQATHHYFVDILDDDAHLLVEASKKIKRYIECRKNAEWVDFSEDQFPKIIFVCKTEDAVKRVQKRCEVILNKAWTTDVNLEVTTSNEINLGQYS
jgi:hypothetical protein